MYKLQYLNIAAILGKGIQIESHVANYGDGNKLMMELKNYLQILAQCAILNVTAGTATISELDAIIIQ